MRPSSFAVGVPQLRKRAIFMGVRDDLDLARSQETAWMRSRTQRGVTNEPSREAIRDLPKRVSPPREVATP